VNFNPTFDALQGDTPMAAKYFINRKIAAPKLKRATFYFRLFLVISFLFIFAAWADHWIRGELGVGEKMIAMAKGQMGLYALAIGGLLYVVLLSLPYKNLRSISHMEYVAFTPKRRIMQHRNRVGDGECPIAGKPQYGQHPNRIPYPDDLFLVVVDVSAVGKLVVLGTRRIEHSLDKILEFFRIRVHRFPRGGLKVPPFANPHDGIGTVPMAEVVVLIIGQQFILFESLRDIVATIEMRHTETAADQQHHQGGCQNLTPIIGIEKYTHHGSPRN
jgi:hypothetical protein